MKLDQVYVISLDHSEEYLKDIFDRLGKIPLPYDTRYLLLMLF